MVKAGIIIVAAATLVTPVSSTASFSLTPVFERNAAAARASSHPGFAEYQRKGRNTGKWARIPKMVALGTKQMLVDLAEIQETAFKKEPRTLAESLKAKRVNADTLKVVVVALAQLYFKLPMLTYAIYVPKVILPSTMFTEEGFHDEIHRQCVQRIRGVSTFLTNLFPEDFHFQEVESCAAVAFKALAAPTPQLALDALTLSPKDATDSEDESEKEEEEKKKKKKKKTPLALRDLPPPLVKGYATACCSPMPLNLQGWAFAWIVRRVAQGQLKDLARTDAVLLEARAKGEAMADLARRDLLELAVTRGVCTGADATDAELATAVDGWLDQVSSFELVEDDASKPEWAHDPLRCRAVLLALNTASNARSNTLTEFHRGLFGSSSGSKGQSGQAGSGGGPNVAALAASGVAGAGAAVLVGFALPRPEGPEGISGAAGPATGPTVGPTAEPASPLFEVPSLEAASDIGEGLVGA